MRPFLLAALLAAGSTAAVAQAAWVRFAPPELNLSLEAPVELKQDKDDPGTAERLSFKGYNGRTADGMIYVVVANNTSTVADARGRTDADLVAQLADGFTRNGVGANAKVVPIAGGAAQELSYERDQIAVRMRIIGKQPWAYNIAVMTAQGDKAKLSGPEAERFFASARLR